MRVVLAQLNLTVGDIFGNTEKMIQSIQEAKKQKADVILFPELSLTAYPPEDLLFRDDLYLFIEKALQQLAAYSDNITIIVGHPEKKEKFCYNVLSVIQQGKISARYRKQELPNYGVFDELRYFTKGNEPCVFELNGIKIGLLICEDIWHDAPIQLAAKAGAEIILVANASPFDAKKYEDRLKIMNERLLKNTLPLLYVNLVGGQDELVFDGGSFALNGEGHCVAQAPFFEEAFLIVDIEKNSTQKIKISSPQKVEIPTVIDRIYKALVLSVRDYMHKNQFKGVYLGLSGGIDSALVLAIAVDAIGSKNVSALMMPSRYTHAMSLEDAKALAVNLKVDYHEVSIESVYTASLTALKPLFLSNDTKMTEENIQSRTRGMFLMACANQFQKLVLTTGNKSEVSVGYCTLYGDTAGAFDVLKDVSKTSVYELAHYRNQLSKVIPLRILTRAPSAELSPNQTDQDKLPPYAELDDMLKAYVEEDASFNDLVAKGYSPKILKDILRWVEQNEYKRRQSPLGPRVTSRALGKDRRYPITSGFIKTLLREED